MQFSDSRSGAHNPSGADRTVGEWLSLVEHLVRDQGVGGSNPLSPTIFSSSCKDFSWVHLGCIGCNWQFGDHEHVET
jgi:hypothetical protein